MRIATATVLSGLVLLLGAVLGVSPGVSFAVGITALVAGSFALAVALEDRTPDELPSPAFARIQHGIEETGQ